MEEEWAQSRTTERGTRKALWDASGRFTTLSGKVQPTLRAEAGRIERWRMIHAGVHDTIRQLAVTASRIPASGNRAIGIYVSADDPGRTACLDRPELSAANRLFRNGNSRPTA